MPKTIYYLIILTFFFLLKANAQETFESKAKKLAADIENLTFSEKTALKKDIELIEAQFEKGEITAEQLQDLKSKAAQERAKNIELEANAINQKLSQLVQDKVDGKFKDTLKDNEAGQTIVFGGKVSDTVKGKEYNMTSMKIYKSQKDKMERQSKRTTSQLVFASGINNLVTNKSVANADFRYWGSHFYEWGLTFNSRIFKNNNLLHAKYGMSLMYNNLRPTNNRIFEVSGNQTNLVTSPNALSDSRFRSVNLVFPVHLEFDFSKKKLSKDKSKSYFTTHQSLRLGVGGYAGFNTKTKQLTSFENAGHDITVKEKNNFNTNDFVYGLSTYIGYKATSLYLKYDLNPMFKDNVVKQNNVSLGLRFDFN